MHGPFRYQEEDNYDDNALAWFKQFSTAQTEHPDYLPAAGAAEASFLTAQQEVFDNPSPTIPAVNEPIPEQ